MKVKQVDLIIIRLVKAKIFVTVIPDTLLLYLPLNSYC